jgi:hypothetical protein
MKRKRFTRSLGMKVSERDYAWLEGEAERRDLALAELVRELVGRARAVSEGESGVIAGSGYVGPPGVVWVPPPGRGGFSE